MQNFVAIALVMLVPTAVFAGTRRAQAGEEDRALSIWAKYCSNGRDGGIDNGIFIHCKHALGPETYQLRETVNTNVNSQQREQYIFVQPPSLHFDHALRVNGGSTLEPKTIVYVQPAKTSHSYQADVEVKAGDHPKPELVFLSSGGQGSGSGISPVSKNFPTLQPAAFFNDRSQASASASASASAFGSSSGNHVVVQG